MDLTFRLLQEELTPCYTKMSGATVLLPIGVFSLATHMQSIYCKNRKLSCAENLHEKSADLKKFPACEYIVSLYSRNFPVAKLYHS